MIQRETKQSILDISLPNEINYWYHFNQKTSWGLLSQLEGDMYSFIGEKVNQYDKNGQLVSSDNRIGLAYSSVTFGPAVKVSLLKGVSVIMRTGVALSRRYQYWLPEEQEMLRYKDHPAYINLTGHDYSGEEVDFPIKNSGFFKVSMLFGV